MFTKATDLVALHFSDSGLVALRLASKDQKYTIAATSSVSLKPGIIEDGRILSLPDLTKAVSQLLAEAKPQALKPKEVAICLPESKVFSVAVQLPSALSVSEVSDSLRRKVAEVIPVEDQLLVADYQKHVVGEQTEYFYAAAYQTILDDFTKLFDSLHIKIRMATLESLALATILRPKEEKQTALILDIGSRSTIATIVTNDFVRESVTIMKAGDAWTKSIMEAQSLSWEESEAKKQSLGIISTPDNAIAPILLPWFQRWSAEIKLFMTYWQQNHSEQISTIILAGGSAHLPGLVEYSQAVFGLPVIMGQVPSGLSLNRIDAAKYTTALGLAIMTADEKLDDINFVEPKLKSLKPQVAKATILKQKTVGISSDTKASAVATASPNRRILVLLAMLIIVILVFGLVWWRSLSTTSSTQIPAYADIQDDQSAEIVFLISTIATSTQDTSLPVLAGSVEPKSLQFSDRQLTSRYWQTIKDKVSAAGADNNNKNVVYQALLRDQTEALWNENTSKLSTDYEASGLQFIRSYLSYSIATSSPALEVIVIDADQLFSLTVNFETLVVDKPAFNDLLQGSWEAKFQQPLTTDYQLSNILISPFPDGSYEVRLRVNPLVR